MNCFSRYFFDTLNETSANFKQSEGKVIFEFLLFITVKEWTSFSLRYSYRITTASLLKNLAFSEETNVSAHNGYELSSWRSRYVECFVSSTQEHAKPKVIRKQPKKMIIDKYQYDIPQKIGNKYIMVLINHVTYLSCLSFSA